MNDDDDDSDELLGTERWKAGGSRMDGKRNKEMKIFCF